MTPEELAQQQAQAETPKGRAAYLDLYKQHNPDMESEPDEDELFEHARKGYAERDELQGKYSSLNSSNEKLASVVSEDPRFAQFIAMVAAGENLMYALGKTFGNLVDNIDEDSLEELRKGQQEFSAKFAKVKENFNAYDTNLKAYAETNGLSPEMVEKIDNAIMDIAEAFNDRDIPTDVIELVHKGLDYDEEKQALGEAEALAIKNKTIDEMKGGGGKPVAVMPDVQGAKRQAERKQVPAFEDESYKPYSERLEKK